MKVYTYILEVIDYNTSKNTFLEERLAKTSLFSFEVLTKLPSGAILIQIKREGVDREITFLDVITILNSISIEVRKIIHGERV